MEVKDSVTHFVRWYPVSHLISFDLCDLVLEQFKQSVSGFAATWLDDGNVQTHFSWFD